MEDTFYNILWIDDEHETLSGTKGRAKRNGINLIPFKSLNGGMSELERNYPFYDGVLLDAMIFEYEDDVKGSEDTYNVHRAKEQLLQLKKKFEIFVLTGQAEAYEDKTFKKAFTKVYKKVVMKKLTAFLLTSNIQLQGRKILNCAMLINVFLMFAQKTILANMLGRIY